MLQILDSVRVHELPSAAGLILKLASQSSGPARLASVKAVRQKLRLTPQAMTPGVLDAFRLVVMQHADVAQEIVEGIDRQCGSLTAIGSPAQVTHSLTCTYTRTPCDGCQCKHRQCLYLQHCCFSSLVIVTGLRTLSLRYN